MSRRDDNTVRCDACRMHVTLCICAILPRLATRACVTVLVLHRDSRKPHNTARRTARKSVDNFDLHPFEYHPAIGFHSPGE